MEILEFLDATEKPEQSSVATEQEDLENALFLELNIFQVSEFPSNFFSLIIHADTNFNLFIYKIYSKVCFSI